MLEVSEEVSGLRVYSFNLKRGRIASPPTLAILEVEHETSCMPGKLSNKDLHLKLRPSPF